MIKPTPTLAPTHTPTVAVVFGTRPEAIKMAPVVLAFRAEPRLRTIVCVTGQHRQMLDQILTTFGITPDLDLNVMEPGQTLAGLTAKTITKLDQVFADYSPNLMLVQGDTTTAFASALAAFYKHVPVGHVEAGLRTGNLESPWPEEANRVLISRLAALHFAPTNATRDNLLQENIPADRVHMVGNPVVDALHLAIQQIDRDPPIVAGVPAAVLNGTQRLVLITGHRRENFGGQFEAICHAIADLATRFPDVAFVYPVHLNPNVREPVNRILRNDHHANVTLLEPLAYREFITLFRRATLVLSDSGGIQEEAPSLGKPVLLMRDTTERPEAVEAGAVKLVGTDRTQIVNEATRLLTNAEAYRSMATVTNPYGDGHAAERIRAACLAFLGITP